MSSILEHVDAAYTWLSKVTVSGDSVDYLAMARQELRAAQQEALSQAEKEANKEDG